MLVGNTSNSFFLVHNENITSPYCDPRPFRVNAGAVHAYILCPENKTKYLIEAVAGIDVLIVDPKGNTSIASIGRTKIERRPMLLVEGENDKKQPVGLVVQNAETIRLTAPDGSPKSVVQLKKGDNVLGYFTTGGRHFGEAVEETIREY